MVYYSLEHSKAVLYYSSLYRVQPRAWVDLFAKVMPRTLLKVSSEMHLIALGYCSKDTLLILCVGIGPVVLSSRVPFKLCGAAGALSVFGSREAGILAHLLMDSEYV